MNIKSEQEQIADRLASIIESVNTGGISGSVVNLNYLTEEFRNKKIPEDATLVMKAINIKCLLDLLAQHQQVIDIAYGNKQLISYRQYKKNREDQAYQAKKIKEDLADVRTANANNRRS